MRKLAATWKPAKTRLAIQHASADPFGVAFGVRFAPRAISVLEFTPPGRYNRPLRRPPMLPPPLTWPVKQFP